MVKFRRQWNKSYKGSASRGEVNTLPSETVPDMTLTVLELLQNHSRGISSNVKENKGEYFGDSEIPVFEDPLTEVPLWKESLRKRYEQAERLLKDETTPKQKENGTDTPKNASNEAKDILQSPENPKINQEQQKQGGNQPTG